MPCWAHSSILYQWTALRSVNIGHANGSRGKQAGLLRLNSALCWYAFSRPLCCCSTILSVPSVKRQRPHEGTCDIDAERADTTLGTQQRIGRAYDFEQAETLMGLSERHTHVALLPRFRWSSLTEVGLVNPFFYLGCKQEYERQALFTYLHAFCCAILENDILTATMRNVELRNWYNLPNPSRREHFPRRVQSEDTLGCWMKLLVSSGRLK